MKSQFLDHQPADWNQFLADSPFGDILQTWEWGEVKKDELWQPLRLRITEQDQILAQAQILIRQLPLGLKLYYLPRGPVLDYTAPNASTTLEYLLKTIHQHAQQNRGLLIKIGPAVTATQAPHLAKHLQQLHLKPATQAIQTQYTSIVSLQGSDADLLNSFDKDTRNLIRRSAREGVIVDCFTATDDTKHLRTFHNLYMATSERANFSARPWPHISKLWQIMAPRQMAYLYTASFREDNQDQDQALAASLVLRLGHTAYQLWSGSRRDTGKKYPAYALQWTIMQHQKSLGTTHYDMWGVAPSNDPHHPWAGITLFKKSFKGQQTDYIGDYDLPVSPLYPLYQLATTLRHKLLGQH